MTDLKEYFKKFSENYLFGKTKPVWRAVWFCLSFIFVTGFVMFIVFSIAAALKMKRIPSVWSLFFLYLPWLGIIYIFRRYMDDKSLQSLGLNLDSNVFKFFMGLIWGAVLITLVFDINIFLGNLAAKSYAWESYSGAQIFLFLSNAVFYLLISAFMEELVFRGYILQNLIEGLNVYLAVGISSLIFALLHIINAGFNILGILNIFLFGIILSLLYLYGRNLWLLIGLHFAWNFCQINIFGFPVYGFTNQSLIELEMGGLEILNGRQFWARGEHFEYIRSLFRNIDSSISNKCF
ncbi:MAG TPA: CPBP family intramembrane metalloprotease [Actinobacteria bacterium]|nr:CPBP family intramembrane metalloprotease [Actinomycetota bacterium]